MADLVKEDPTHILNHDVLMIYDMCNRHIREYMYSQSSVGSGMNEHDIARARSYVNALNGLCDWIVGRPLLDLPETHPRPYALEPKPETVTVESEVCNMMVRMTEALRTEMIHSASAAASSTMNTHDERRFRLITEKMLAFLNDYVEPLTPIDLPESSPDEPLSGHGSGGVGAPN